MSVSGPVGTNLTTAIGTLALANLATGALPSGITVTNANVVAGAGIAASKLATFYEIDRKTANQAVNNSTTLTNVTDLVTSSLAANSDWHIEMGIIYSSTGGTPDMKLDAVIPTGATYRIGSLGLDNVDAFASRSSADTDAAPRLSLFGTGAAQRLAFLTGILRIGTNAGTFQLQFAQNVATAEDTNILSNSYIKIVRVSPP